MFGRNEMEVALNWSCVVLLEGPEVFEVENHQGDHMLVQSVYISDDIARGGNAVLNGRLVRKKDGKVSSMRSSTIMKLHHLDPEIVSRVQIKMKHAGTDLRHDADKINDIIAVAKREEEDE